MNFIVIFIGYLHMLSKLVPVEVFVFVGALAEELVAPIPSPIVMTTAGAITYAQDKPLLFLFYLALIGAIGKTLGCWLLYLISDWIEDVVVGRFGKYIGVQHKEIESIGKYFGNSTHNFIVIFLMRAIPVIPTAPVSITAGIIKIPVRIYLLASFLGVCVRNIIYLWIGYAGSTFTEDVLMHLDRFESVISIAGVFGLAIVVSYIYYRRSRSNPFDWFFKSGKKSGK